MIKIYVVIDVNFDDGVYTSVISATTNKDKAECIAKEFCDENCYRRRHWCYAETALHDELNYMRKSYVIITEYEDT